MMNRKRHYNVEEFELEHSDRKDSSIHSVATIYAFALLAICFGLYGIGYWMDNNLPNGLTLTDEPNNPNRFIAERAKNHLKVLTAIGPKVTGSYENEVLAVDFLKREISFVVQQADASQRIESDVQSSSGSYYLDYKPYGFVNAYANVQNVIVKLHSHNDSDTSVLVNCHFDSVPTSPGASDDGINCAVMLEVLRVLSKNKVRPSHNVIFLFNGAEENPLQAAHGFVTAHEWAVGVKIVVNLEACGSGGREILFQNGPDNPWLINYYSDVPHPYAQVAGEEIFQSNIIPSDTDFRIFRDFGNVTGYDFAFKTNGYVYHTKHDSFDIIPLGSYQHVGDNVLKLMQGLANAPELSRTEQETGKVVYYDFLGLFLIHYPYVTGVILNVATVVLFLTILSYNIWRAGNCCCKKNVRSILITAGTIPLSWIAAIGFNLLVGKVLDAANRTMSWYNKPWLIFGLYVAPAIAVSCLFITVLNRFKYQKHLGLGAQTQMQLHANCLIWCVFAVIMTCFGLRTTHVLMISILFYTAAFIVIFLFRLQHKGKLWLIIYLAFTIIPSLTVLYQAHVTLDLFVPIFGRMGSNRNPEYILGLITFVLFTIVYSFYVPLISLVRKPYYFIGSLFAVFVLTIVVICTPLGFPYSGNENSLTPQRYWIWHTDRTFYDAKSNVRRQDSGYLFLNMDRNSPRIISNDVKELENSTTVTKDCDTELLCGVPVYMSRMLQIVQESTWVPAPPPIITLPTSLRLAGQENITDTIRRYQFIATGPSHMSVFFAPRPKTQLVKWSFLDEIPNDQIIINDRKNYFILFASGNDTGTLEFWLDLQVPAENWNDSVLDIALSGKYIGKKYPDTKEFTSFLASFPDWTHVTAWIATYRSWVY